MDKPEVVKISVELVQEGNTLGTTDETEVLIVDFEYQMPGEIPFTVIKTEGWSFDGVDEFTKLIKMIEEAEFHIREELK